MLKSPEKRKAKNRAPALPHFLWRRLGGSVLLTNSCGSHAVLSPAEFERYKAGRLGGKDRARAALEAGGFLRERMDFEGLASALRSRNSHLSFGPSLHIFVLTLRCNHKCAYCQSGALGGSAKGADMSWATASRCLDFAFRTTAPGLTIEFQGGEPLLNWEVLKKTVRRARALEGKTGKKLSLALVSNFSLMTEDKAKFLLDNEVSVCTSLDGPADLHNANRAWAGGNSYAAAAKWLKYFSAKADGPQRDTARVFRPGAILTVTRRSLGRAREIVAEYARLGLGEIFVRPMAPIGFARRAWDNIGYTPEEFAGFYSEALRRVIELGRKGSPLKEKTAELVLQKVLGARDPGFLDLRCPCGASIGQLAYNWNGDLYTCDEGRMVGWEGDEIFRVGNAARDPYKKVMGAAATRACVASSCLEAQPACSRCAYSPFCGVCPVYNYEAQGSLWGDMASNARCAQMKAVFDAVFAALARPADRKVLEGWIKK